MAAKKKPVRKVHENGKVVKITRNRESVYRGVCGCAAITEDFESQELAKDALREHASTV